MTGKLNLKKQEEKPWFVIFASFWSVNAPPWSITSYLHNFTLNTELDVHSCLLSAGCVLVPVHPRTWNEFWHKEWGKSSFPPCSHVTFPACVKFIFFHTEGFNLIIFMSSIMYLGLFLFYGGGSISIPCGLFHWLSAPPHSLITRGLSYSLILGKASSFK